MIKSPSSSENKILLFTEKKNEKVKMNDKNKLYDKKNITSKNKYKKEEEKDASNKNNNKKTLSKFKENQIKTVTLNEITKNYWEKIRQTFSGNNKFINNKNNVFDKININLDNIDISTEVCGVKLENPFMLSSSVVGSRYEMIKRAFKQGWAGVSFKTICMMDIHESSPRFSVLKDWDESFLGFKNIEEKKGSKEEKNKKGKKGKKIRS